MKLILIILVLCAGLRAQGVFEPVNSEVYNFLKTLSIKGIIIFDYEIKPLPRIVIAKKLIEADNNSQRVTLIEKELLNFYLLDFKHEINLIKQDFESASQPEFIITEKDERIRLFEYAGKDFSFFADQYTILHKPICKKQTHAGAGIKIKIQQIIFFITYMMLCNRD